MGIRSLSFVLAIVTLVLFASALPKSCFAQAPTVVLATQEFKVVANKPNPKLSGPTYCTGNDIYFTFEPVDKYSSREYLLFYYLDESKALSHDEALLKNVTLVTDNTVRTPIARLVRTEGGEKIWDLLVTEEMKRVYAGCLSKLTAQ